MIPRWLVWSLLAVCSWGLWAILATLITQDSVSGGQSISPSHNQAISTIGMLPIIAALALFKEPPAPQDDRARTRRGALFALAAGILSCLGNLPYYRALGSGAKAATVVPLTALYPLVTVLLAIGFLKERLNRIQLAGIAVSLVAIYLLNVPDEENMLSVWLLGAAASIVLWGAAGFFQKVSTRDISGARSAFWFLAAFLPVGALIVLEDPLPTNIPWRIWSLSIAMGFTLAFGNLALLVAFARGGKASIVVPLTALYPLVAIPIAVFALGERVGARESIGIALAAVAVVLLVLESPAAPVAIPPTDGSQVG